MHLSYTLIPRELIKVVNQQFQGPRIHLRRAHLEYKLLLELRIQCLFAYFTLQVDPVIREETEAAVRVGRAGEVPGYEVSCYV